MKEQLLHTIWQYQLFNKTNWTTTRQEPIQVLHPGILNPDAGPDFSQARIVIDGILWQGDVEIHTEEKFWFTHNHHTDPAYNRVILHVVNTCSQTEAVRADSTPVPTTTLAERIHPDTLVHYQQLTDSIEPIACSLRITEVSGLVQISQWERALVERLSRKARELLVHFDPVRIDWNAVTYLALLKAFGFKKNTQAMVELAQRLPYKILLKHRNSVLQLEALLLGTAGLIPAHPSDEYGVKLRQEWQLLLNKYQLKPLEPVCWKFHRMRPANFPDFRLAQLASLINREADLVALMLKGDLVTLLNRLRASPSAYWQHHYHLGKLTKITTTLGKSSAGALIANAILPLRIALKLHRSASADFREELDILSQLPAEDNVVSRAYRSLGVVCDSAWVSQALLEQFSAYCTAKRCLACRIGLSLLKN